MNGALWSIFSIKSLCWSEILSSLVSLPSMDFLGQDRIAFMAFIWDGRWFSKEKVRLIISLMQKRNQAAYPFGGHSFSAAAIEYVILKMKLPHHGPQIVLLLAVEKFKVSEEQRKFAIDSHEPLVTFTLSCGMYSLPSIRIYTAKNVREELEDPQHDYIRAAVAVSNKGRLLVHKNASLLRQKFCG